MKQNLFARFAGYTYRIVYLTGDRNQPLPWRTNPVTYDHGRRTFRQSHL